jgi:CBS domain-containing protein
MMGLLVGDVMQVNVKSVSPDLALPDFEDQLIEARVSGCPVVEQGRMVGVISRADILRQVSLERDLAETTSDFYYDELGFHEVRLRSLEEMAARVGERWESLTVGDCMSRHPIVVEPTQAIEDAARMMVQHRIHRLPVADQGRLVGIITSMDLVQLFADHRAETKG